MDLAGFDPPICATLPNGTTASLRPGASARMTVQSGASTDGATYSETRRTKLRVVVRRSKHPLLVENIRDLRQGRAQRVCHAQRRRGRLHPPLAADQQFVVQQQAQPP